MLALLSKASKRPLLWRTYHERVLGDHHVCSMLSSDGCSLVKVSYSRDNKIGGQKRSNLNHNPQFPTNIQHSTQEAQEVSTKVAVTRDCDVTSLHFARRGGQGPLFDYPCEVPRSLRSLMPPPRAVADGIHLVNCVCCEPTILPRRWPPPRRRHFSGGLWVLQGVAYLERAFLVPDFGNNHFACHSVKHGHSMRPRGFWRWTKACARGSKSQCVCVCGVCGMCDAQALPQCCVCVCGKHSGHQSVPLQRKRRWIQGARSRCSQADLLLPPARPPSLPPTILALAGPPSPHLTFITEEC